MHSGYVLVYVATHHTYDFDVTIAMLYLVEVQEIVYVLRDLEVYFPDLCP